MFGKLQDKLEKLSKELGVGNRVVFAGYRNDVKEILHSVDFCIPKFIRGVAS